MGCVVGHVTCEPARTEHLRHPQLFFNHYVTLVKDLFVEGLFNVSFNAYLKLLFKTIQLCISWLKKKKLG